MKKSQTKSRKAPESHRIVPGLGQPNLGKQIATLRRSRDWTLSKLAEESSVAIATLSKIENGKSGASFDTMTKVAKALGMGLDGILAPARPHFATGRRAISRANEGEKFGFTSYDYTVPCNQLTSKAMVPLVMRIKTREVLPFESWASHEGEEFIYVLSGSILIHSEFYEPLRLDKGDSIYFDSMMKHAFTSVGKGDAEMLSVCLSESLQHLFGSPEGPKNLLSKDK